MFLAACLLAGSLVWNEGIDFYRDGDATNAVRVLRPLLLDEEYGARAAEVVAKLAYDAGDLEEAAAAAQIALRAHPKDARVNRNFTRATDGLLELRETKRINRILKDAQGKDLAQMLRQATHDIRDLLQEATTYRTNTAEKVIARADALAARAEKLADLWIPVKELVCQSVTNEEQAATIALQVEKAQKLTEQSAVSLADLKDEAYSQLAEAEIDFTRFMKMTILPPEALEEDLVCQSNQNHQEALDFTRIFRARFPAWAKQYEQQAQANTNLPPFTVETQAKISDLSTRLEKLQLSEPVPTEDALALIREIQDLLPKSNQGGQAGQQGQPNAQNQNQQQRQQPPNPQENQEQQGDEQTQGEKESPEDEPHEAEGTEAEESPEEQEIEAVLRKAQERSEEHEADKKARMRKAPLPPNERDW